MMADASGTATAEDIAGSYQPGLAHGFRRHLRPGMTVLDVGANIGAFTMLAASVVGPGGCGLAVEPNEANVRLIEASRRANGFGQVGIAFCAAEPCPDVPAVMAAFGRSGETTIDLLLTP